MKRNDSGQFFRFVNKYIISPIRLWKLSITNPRAKEVIDLVQKEKLSYLNYPALIDIFYAAHQIEEKKIDGIFIEAGCALGGSALVIASAKDKNRDFYIYDTFGMIPPPTKNDGEDIQNRWEIISSGKAKGIRGGEYYGYIENLFEHVQQKFIDFNFPLTKNNILLIPGRFEETLKIEQPVAFAHLDCDWYESVHTCLSRIEPLLASGGMLVIDDYNHWSGCQKAVDEYFFDKQGNYYFEFHSRLHVIKK